MTAVGTPLAAILDGSAEAFAVLLRPEATGHDHVEILTGRAVTAATLAELPLPEAAADPAELRHDLLALVPFRQITERGFQAHPDDAPLQAIEVRGQQSLPLAAFAGALPPVQVRLTDGGFDTDDDQYAAIVERVVREEIGRGVGANFVIRRDYRGTLANYSPLVALRIFERLTRQERGVHCSFVVHTPGHTLVGATPERHISVRDGVAVMNPISGTYRYPAGGPTAEGVLEFLADAKETDELFMVVDEELKMMARVCPAGGRIDGPFLKEMSQLAHTEYLITGQTELDPRRVLHDTLFAPTVTGSPLESACRVIARHEPTGRRYYSGVLALMSSIAGRRELDSSILIRTAEIDDRGGLTYGVGATLVRHSDPQAEARETRAKAAGFLAAVGGEPASSLAEDPRVSAALAARNDAMAGFWRHPAPAPATRPGLAGLRALVVDAEDTFTAMIALQLQALGLVTTVLPHDRAAAALGAGGGTDLLVLGPGPGDPTDLAHPRIAAMSALADTALRRRLPMLAVCLSHQVLCQHLGLPLVRRRQPNQGVQGTVELFGRTRTVGFYNAFAARVPSTGGPGDTVATPHGPVRAYLDAHTAEVHALVGRSFTSVQFHPESVLSLDGPELFAELLDRLPLPAATGPRVAG